MSKLRNRDYTLIIDKSGSMSTKDQAGGKSRWDVMQESTLALASKCEEFDPDGITVYTFSSQFRRYDNVTAKKVTQIFQENEPLGRTEMAEVLNHAFDDYFQRRKSGKTKANGEIILVVTDGQPENKKSVMKAIIEATKRLDGDEEIGISFIQIGNDSEATTFLKGLDDDIQGLGAKFDIVDTITMEEIEKERLSLTEVLLRTLED
ncbi:MAG: VWA domain-containing protein [Microcystis aeruginosa K13-07]|jgi:Mg-chelatase subunit ChlD|nr:VWA domain-containing protein [Microcystis aeruginosa G13-11]NCS79524.1 VWA domain-containing protein [Microcystis aeruginosa K13-07]